MQGEVLELELEAALKSAFPSDIIKEVAKGVKGADVVQTIVSPSGRPCDSLVWELKRTKKTGVRDGYKHSKIINVG
jgi:hypothetical protein